MAWRRTKSQREKIIIIERGGREIKRHCSLPVMGGCGGRARRGKAKEDKGANGDGEREGEKPTGREGGERSTQPERRRREFWVCRVRERKRRGKKNEGNFYSFVFAMILA